MAFYLAIKIFISILLLGTLLSLKKKIYPIELIGSYLISASLFEILYNIISVNSAILKTSSAKLGLPLIQLDRLVVYPILTIWLLYFLRRQNIKYLQKYFIALLWSSMVVAIVFLNQHFKVAESQGWYAFIGYVEAFVMFVSFMGLSYIFHSIWVKEARQ